MDNLSISKIEIIAVDRQKETPDNLQEGMDIGHVPTFILYNNDTELNRIVEYPLESLEKDLITIIQEKNYKPNYSN